MLLAGLDPTLARDIDEWADITEALIVEAYAAPVDFEKLHAAIQGMVDVVPEAEFKRRVAADPAARAGRRAMMAMFGEGPAQPPER